MNLFAIEKEGEKIYQCLRIFLGIQFVSIGCLAIISQIWWKFNLDELVKLESRAIFLYSATIAGAYIISVVLFRTKKIKIFLDGKVALIVFVVLTTGKIIGVYLWSTNKWNAEFDLREIVYATTVFYILSCAVLTAIYTIKEKKHLRIKMKFEKIKR